MSLIAHTTIECQGTTPKTSAAVNTTGANLLVMVIGYDRSPSDTPSVSDSKGNTWFGLTAQLEAAFPANRIFYAWNPTVGSGHTFTATVPLADGAVSCMAFDNVQFASDPFDQQNGTTNSGSESQHTGSVTPSTNFQLLIAGWCSGFARTPTIDNGFSVVDGIPAAGSDYGVFSAYLIQGTAAAIDPMWMWIGQGASRSAVTIATFKTLGAPPVSAVQGFSFVAG